MMLVRKNHPRVDHALEQHERLHHAVLAGLFEQHLVVLGERGAEDDGGDGLEAVDPFFALRALPADVEHVDRELAHAEPRFDDAG